MARCLIGCGSNLGRRREQLDRAVELLRFMPGVEMLAVSHYRETVAVGGPPDQDPFLNAACLLETALPPRAVLEMLAAVENTLARDRRERWGPRTIDLDLLLYDDVVMDSPELTLPHPRMATRRFVLEPAAEIAATLPHPRSGCTVGDLLANIAAAHPFVTVVGVPGSGAAEVAAAVADASLARLIHAPAAWPMAEGGQMTTLAHWRRTLAAWSAPLHGAAWDDEPHVTVADYWCGSLVPAATGHLDADDAARFAGEAAAELAPLRVPTAAILQRVDAATLEERIAFRARHAHGHTDVFGDLAPAAVLCDRSATPVVELMAAQERIAAALLSAGRRSTAPLAVIAVDATDLARAADEAIAAVEAML
ncbi:MAG: 2-amino-4-hydroxy-6-hydroxymethyldihydropteridine diphosphokinase [Planctomycetaceae bacterium]